MKPTKVKGSIESLLGKEMEVEEMGKVLQLSDVIYFLTKGCAMTDYPLLGVCKSSLLFKESLVTK